MRNKQLDLNLSRGRHGGRRPGAGRQRVHSPGVAHTKRVKVTKSTPLHINFKYRIGIKNKTCLKILKAAILNARRHGLKVIHFSLQHNHIHLLVEASDNETLTRGMRSLTVTFARRVGKGKIQLERFHLHVLKSLREAQNAVKYVLFNEQRHQGNRVDCYSSLLSLPIALKLIRKFVVKNRKTLIVEVQGDYGELSEAQSFLLKKAINSPA